MESTLRGVEAVDFVASYLILLNWCLYLINKYLFTCFVIKENIVYNFISPMMAFGPGAAHMKNLVPVLGTVRVLFKRDSCLPHLALHYYLLTCTEEI